jgi:hypothetical protein
VPALLVATALASPAPAQETTLPVFARPPIERVELAAGPCRDAWVAAGERVSLVLPQNPIALPELAAAGDAGAGSCEPLVDLDAATWSSPRTWCQWGRMQALAFPAASAASGAPAAAGGSARDDRPAWRRWLALLALRQGRWEDAWAHFAACDRPGELMLFFLPGIPLFERGEAALDALPDGVLLAPAPPPPTPGFPAGYLDEREAWVRGLRVGSAVIDLRVAIEPEGVQVDVVHVAGGAARLSVRLPEPDGFEIRVAYVDWLRQDEVGVPLALEVRPGDDTHSVYGRCLPRAPAWPTGAAEHVPAAIEREGLWLVTQAGDPDLERLEAVSQALGRVDGGVVQGGLPARGVAFHVPPPGPERERKLTWLASAYEAFERDAAERAGAPNADAGGARREPPR